MDLIVTKFGGSSLANAVQIGKAVDIIRANDARRYVVVSAPGKRNNDDVKVTDLLYECHNLASNRTDFSGIFDKIKKRFSEVINGLGIKFDLENELGVIYEHLVSSPERDYCASRGEYLNAKIVAKYLGFKFVDAYDTIFFQKNGRLDEEKTFRIMGEKLSEMSCAVIPGFYGVMPDGKVRTFSRGGSDVTGAIAARSVNASLYENWTDVSGLLSADPRVVTEPKVIDTVTYTELRELSYMGASVLHEDAIFPVRKAGIPINIRNTNHPEDPGTMIVPHVKDISKKRKVTGIAGRKGFSAIVVGKSMMNSEVGFGARLLQIFAEHGVAFEHCPSGIDTLSVIVNTDSFFAAKDQILDSIQSELNPEEMSVDDGLAMIAVVGQGMAFSRGTAVKVFESLADAGINIRMIDQGPSELNIIVGVDEMDYEKAVRAIYKKMEPLM